MNLTKIFIFMSIQNNKKEKKHRLGLTRVIRGWVYVGGEIDGNMKIK